MSRKISLALALLLVFALVGCTPSHGYPTMAAADTTKATKDTAKDTTDGTAGASAEK